MSLHKSRPVTKAIAAKIYFELKTISVTGSANIISSSTIPTGAANAVLTESFFTIGTMGQYYFGTSFWAGVGLQLDKPSSGTLNIVGFNPSALANSDMPNFFYMYGVVGYDFQISNNFFIVPDIRVGALFSTPLIIEADATLGIAYAF